jgi:para-nitrobenzyl esterase
MAGVPGERGSLQGDEDCLYLNVYTPRFEGGRPPAGNDRLPVMLWIHGGGNTIGHGGFYDGGNLAVARNVIVVTTNYRIGPMGWMRLAALRADAANDAEASGNFATLDLARALEWVRDNIAAFGGDPGNVTIFGESAGGTNVFSLLLAPQAKGLFQRAIAQSGGMRFTPKAVADAPVDDATPEHARYGQSPALAAARLLLRAGRAKSEDEARALVATMPAAELARFLRGLPWRDVLGAYDVTPTGMIHMHSTLADGVVLPADPLERLAQPDGWNRVPVMLGTNRDENKLFMFFDPANVKRWFGILPRLVDEPRYLATAEALSRMWKATGADEPAAAMRRVQSDVFVYRFDWDEQPSVLGADLSKMVGAAHGFEIPFVFGHFDLGREGSVMFDGRNEPGRLELSRAMQSYWTEFARSGAPGRGHEADLPSWTPFDDSDAAAPRTMLLDSPAGGGTHMASLRETRAGVVAAVDADTRLRDQRERCAVYHDLANWSSGISVEQYATAGREGCAPFPFDAYPWKK